MSDHDFEQEDQNRRYQRDLATALVSSLGSRAAYEFCHINGWQGVLAVLGTDRPVGGRTDDGGIR